MVLICDLSQKQYGSLKMVLGSKHVGAILSVLVQNFYISALVGIINLLTSSVKYSGRTAPLTSKVAFYIFIQQIQIPNILNMVYTLRFFLFKMQFVSQF